MNVLHSTAHRPESLPCSVEIESQFGKYAISIEHTENRIVCVRTRVARKGLCQPEEYGAYLKFMNAVARYDQQSMVLIRY